MNKCFTGKMLRVALVLLIAYKIKRECAIRNQTPDDNNNSRENNISTAALSKNGVCV